jgi:hypothetical protein
MGKRIIISESEKKNILSLYETTNVAPPPSESVLVANKNPFKYPEYESARQTYSSNLKDGDMFYEIKSKQYYDESVINSFATDFIEKLNNKTLRAKNSYGEDYIVTFYGPIDTSKKGYEHDGFIGKIEIKLNEDNPQTYSVYLNKVGYGVGVIGSSSTNQKITLHFNKSEDDNMRWSPTSYPQIDELLNKEYKEFVIPKLKIENIPDSYFEIRKIQRQQTDF